MTPINLKLVNLLSSLSEKELKEFKKFVSSGLYARGRNYLPLLNHLLKYKIKGSDNILIRDLYTKLYPGKKFSNQTLKNRFSELYKMGEEFFVYMSLKENKIEKEKILLKKLLEKKLFTPFEGRYKKICKEFTTEKYDDKKYEDILFFQELNSTFLEEKKKLGELYDQYFENSQKKLCLILIELFKTGFEFSLQEYDNRKYELNYVTDFLRKLDIEDIMDNFSRSKSDLQRVTAMNYYLYKVYENPGSEEYYFKSHKMFTELSGSIKENYKIRIFNQMIYYCIRKQNEGIKKFQYELFKLYNEKLNQGLYSDLKNKIYLQNNFRDYVFIGLAIKDYKWVEEFIRKYSRELPDEFRNDEVKLSYSKLDIEHKNYERALLNLNNIRTDNYLLYLDLSILKLCCFYELDKFEEAYLELDKMRHYLRNHTEIPVFHKIPNTNFIKIYQKLLKEKTQYGYSEIGFLEKEINQYKSISKRDWLLEKTLV